MSVAAPPTRALTPPIAEATIAPRLGQPTGVSGTAPTYVRTSTTAIPTSTSAAPKAPRRNFSPVRGAAWLTSDKSIALPRGVPMPPFIALSPRRDNRAPEFLQPATHGRAVSRVALAKRPLEHRLLRRNEALGDDRHEGGQHEPRRDRPQPNGRTDEDSGHG